MARHGGFHGNGRHGLLQGAMFFPDVYRTDEFGYADALQSHGHVWGKMDATGDLPYFPTADKNLIGPGWKQSAVAVSFLFDGWLQVW
jgi:hypothetical protein